MSAWIAHSSCGPRTRLRLFCFPYSGGPASIYRSWGQGLPPEIGVCPVELPGRGARWNEPPLRRVPELIAGLLPALMPYLTPPFAFFGYSLGALIGFELARELRRRHAVEPVHLFTGAMRAPHKPRRFKSIARRPQDEFIECLRHLQGTPEAVLADADLMEMLLPALRADFEASETWQYAEEPPLACSISTFGGEDDALVDRSELEAWGEHTRAAFRLRMVPGGHFFLEGERPQLLDAISKDLVPRLR